MSKLFTTIMVIHCFSLFVYSDVVFDLNASSYSMFLELGATKKGEIAVFNGQDPYIDFKKNGVIKIEGVSFSKQAFTIESRFQLTEYPSIDPIISDLLGAYDCDYNNTGVSEGVNFRVGGGYNYPIKFGDAWKNLEQYVRPDNVLERANLSKCIGEMALGTGTRIWKETFINRGIETNVWTHLAATWDGHQMNLFLNGVAATDEWRTIGAEESVLIRDTSVLYIGNENFDSRRHFDGKLSYLKIHNKVLTPEEIRSSYHQTSGRSPCTFQIIITSPRAGEAVCMSTPLTFSVVFTESCSNTPIPEKFSIQISPDPTFSTDVLSFQSTSLQTTLASLMNGDFHLKEGTFFIRIVATQNHLSKTASSSTVQSAPQPVYFVAIPSVNINKPVVTPNSEVRNTSRVLYDCRGRRLQATSGFFSMNQVNNGVYFVTAGDREIRKFALIR